MGHASFADNLDWLVASRNCPGFCGRILNDSRIDEAQISTLSDLYSVCQACPWGERSGKNSICEKCTTPLRPYDYCFLIFHALIPLFVNGCFVKFCFSKHTFCSSIQRQKLWNFAQVLCVILEPLLALIFSLLLFEPYGTFKTYGCIKRDGFQDWYPIFYNPIINYTKSLRCSYELVYPLYTLPFLNLALCLLNLIVIRSCLYLVARAKFGVCIPSTPYYAALWVLPIVASGHAFLSGMFYYIFPHICVIASLAFNAIHLASEGRKTVSEMFRLIFSLQNPEHFVLILIHMVLFGFGTTSIVLAGHSSISNLNFILLMITMMPVPTCFYILTIRLTTPIRAVRYHH